MWLLALLKGILVGICASIPLGPVGVICVQQTVNRGRRAGFASGYGAALADTLFATVAFLSLSVILDFIEEHRQIIQVGGGGNTYCSRDRDLCAECDKEVPPRPP